MFTLLHRRSAARRETGRDERGMTTAEYAVGTVGATLVAGVLIPVVPPIVERWYRLLLDALLSPFSDGGLPSIFFQVPLPW